VIDPEDLAKVYDELSGMIAQLDERIKQLEAKKPPAIHRQLQATTLSLLDRLSQEQPEFYAQVVGFTRNYRNELDRTENTTGLITELLQKFSRRAL